MKRSQNSIGLLTLILILFYTAIGISSPLITLHLAALGASFSRISLILASAAALSLACDYLWGRLSDKLGRRKSFIVAGLGGLALAYELMHQAPTPAAAWTAWLLAGLSQAAYLTTGLALMGDVLAQGEKRGQKMGTYRGLGSLAFAIGAVLGGRLADLYSLPMAFRGCAVFFSLAALVALTLAEQPASPTARAAAPEPLPASPNRPLPWLFLGGVFLWVTALASSAAMWPNFMTTLGYSKTTISSLWGLAAFVEAPMMRLAGTLSDVVGRTPLLISGGLGIVLVMAGYVTLYHWLPALVGVQIGRGVAYASYTTSAMIFATEWGDQKRRGQHSGLFNATSGAGQLLGLLLSGTIVDALGFTMLFSLCAIFAGLSALCFWGLSLSTALKRPVVSP
jgi:MFS family permease